MGTIKPTDRPPNDRLVLALRGSLLRLRLIALELQDKNAPEVQIFRVQARCQAIQREIDVLLMGGNPGRGGWQ